MNEQPNGALRLRDRDLLIEEIYELKDWNQASEHAVYIKLKKQYPPDYEWKIDGPLECVLRYEWDPKLKTFKVEVAREQRQLPETQPSKEFTEENEDLPTIYKELRSEQGKYVYFRDEICYDSVALGSIASYFRSVFSSFPYFDFCSSSNETGKTTALEALIWPSFYGFVREHPTEAVIFRMLNDCHGALGIDELDNLLKDKSLKPTLLALLDAGYKKGLLTPRVEVNSRGERVIGEYDSFGLKAWSRTSAIDHSLLSRAITIPMIRNKGFKQVEYLTGPEVFAGIREKLYSYSLRNWKLVEEQYKAILEDKELKGRLAELFNPLLTIAKLISEYLYQKVLDYANSEAEQREESDPWACTLLELIWKSELFGDQASQDLKGPFSDLLQAKDLLDEKQTVNTRLITRLLKSLGFRRSTKKTHGKTWFSIGKGEVKQQLTAHSMEELIEAKAPTSKLSNQSNLSNPTILGSEGEKGEKSEFLGDIEKDTHPAPSLKQDGQLKQKEEEEITKPHPFFKSTKEIRHPSGSRIPESSELYLAERYYDLHPDIPKLFFVKDIEREFATNFQSFWEAFYDWLKGPNGKEKTGKQNNLDNPKRSFGPTPAHGICEYCGEEKEIWLDKHGRWACSGCLKEVK
jgi:hypothetical protein